MKEIIKSMANRNIGSLCLFLKNHINIDYLNFLNENIPLDISDRPMSEKIFYLVHQLSSLQLCDCGSHKSFIGFKNGYRPTCGNRECFVKRRKKTCIDKYGVDNPKKSKDILDKEQKSIKEKWDGEHYMKNKSVQSKYNKSMIDNHGVEWPQQSKDISKKSKETFDKNPEKKNIIEKRVDKLKNKSVEEKNEIDIKKKLSIEKKWGEYGNFIKYRLEKIREKSIENYGVNHHLKDLNVIEKRIEKYKKTITQKILNRLPTHILYVDKKGNKNETDSIIELKCNNCLSEFEINRQYLDTRLLSNKEICLICNPILSGKSNMEIDVLNFIRENYEGEIISNSKRIIDGELDIYIPDLKLAYEFNGLYWHSNEHKDKNYHLLKTKKCEKIGIQLTHIWEDDWLYKSDIIKSMILNKLGKSNKIYARKCQIKEISDNELVRYFLNKNHIQGFVGSKVKIGLYYEDELVSLMTFGSLRKSLGQKSEDGSYELIRFCNKLNTTIVGGASKLFRYFINHYNPIEIISYSDYSRSNGNMYKNLGFNFAHLSDPNYYYIVDESRHHRFNFRKDKLIKQGFDSKKTEVEIMTERGIDRIFDCGSKKWIFKTT